MLFGPVLAAAAGLCVLIPAWVLGGLFVRSSLRAGGDQRLREWHRDRVIAFALRAVLGGAALAFVVALAAGWL